MDCPICNGEKERILLKRPQFAILECINCRLARTTPESYVTAASYDSDQTLSESYREREVQFRKYAQEQLLYLRRYLSSGCILEVGCSVGTLVAEATAVGFSASGIDLDPAAIDYGKSVGRDLSLGSIDKWDGQFDAVWASHTLEHIEEPISFLKACRDRVQVGGLVGIVVPCHRGLRPMMHRETWYGWVAHQHYFHYSRMAMRLAFSKVGLQTICAEQNSMDYRFKRTRNRTFRQFIVSEAEILSANLGAALSFGDQLVAIGRRI